MHLFNAWNIEHIEKKNMFLEHKFCGNKEILGHLCRLLYFKISVSKTAFVQHVAWHHYIPTFPDFTVLIDGWSYPVNITLYEAPQNKSEINKLWRLILTWHFTSPCVNQIFNQKLGFVYYGIIMFLECEYLIRCVWCFMKCQFNVWYPESPLEHIPHYTCSLVQWIGV